MKLREVLEIIEGKVITRNTDLDLEVKMGCGADLMSDVLAFTHEGTLLMSGLTNPQVVRTAEMAGIQAIVFVRGKIPPPETVALAEEKGIALWLPSTRCLKPAVGCIGQGFPVAAFLKPA
jgi:predicted transcriptional regulator